MGRGIFFSQRAVPPTLQKIDHSDFYFFITITSPIEEVDKDEIDDRRKEHRQGAIVQCSAKACSPGRLLFSAETSCTTQKYSTSWHCLILSCSPAQGVCWRPVPLVDANFDEVSVWYVSHHVVPNQWVFNFRIFLFGELSVKKCSPVISVVAGSIDRPHLAANSKNNQEESQPCCHLGCGWSSVFRWVQTCWVTMGTGFTRELFLTLDSFYPSGNWRHDAPAGLRDRADGQSPEAQGLHLQGWFGIIDSVQSFFYGMAIFSITTLPITIAKNNQFVQSPILTESPNSTTAPARRRWRNIPISWEWSLCLPTILGDNHWQAFRSPKWSAKTRNHKR